MNLDKLRKYLVKSGILCDSKRTSHKTEITFTLQNERIKAYLICYLSNLGELQAGRMRNQGFLEDTATNDTFETETIYEFYDVIKRLIESDSSFAEIRKMQEIHILKKKIQNLETQITSLNQKRNQLTEKLQNLI